MEVKRFVRTEWGPQLIGHKHYPSGSVVEVSETRAKAMVSAGVATLHPGPASEPDSGDDTAEGPPAPKKGKAK